MSSIIYALVVRDPDIVLSEYSRAQGNFPQITRNILSKLPRSGKFSYTYNEKYCYHYISEENIVFICLSDAEFPRRICFLFLDDIKSNFMKRYGQVVNTVIAFGVNAEFAEVLKTRMIYFNTDPNADKLQTIRSSVDQVKNIMIENIDKVLARGEKVELLVKKSEVMSEQAITMKKRAIQVRRKMWFQNIKLYLVCGCVFLFLLLLLMMSVCSPDFSEC
ncbi:unnamed protein product [Blepharisma stoltei]|uniref:Uncharacterized protein n=1 Tax=Blepharisma stoltei TaxID=1481888 RepID=A0AAU9JCE9_9CILI|nr:unnamed protein product [Blepharisma stoltei]